MKRFFLLLFLFSGTVSIYPKLSVGYYYGNYQSYPPSAIDYTSLTHICHAFVWPKTDGTIYMDSWFPLPSLITTAHQHGVKVLVSVGGYGTDPTNGFNTVVPDTALRAKFVKNLVTFCKTYGYDGVDLDWEFPVKANAAAFVAFITELRQAFNSAGITYIAAALPSYDWDIGYTIASLKNLLDWFGVMTYNFTGTWADHAYHNAPLVSTASQPLSVTSSVQTYISKGIPRDKLLIGMAFSGWNLKAAKLFAAHTKDEGTSVLSTEAEQLRHSADWDYYWDDTCKVPYLQNKAHTQIITYDDTMSIRLKCEYIKSNNLGGTIIWALSHSYNGQNSPLLETIGKNLLAVSAVAVSGQAEKFILSVKNYPNPFNPSTTIRYSLPKSALAIVKVYDMLGREVAELVNRQQAPGEYNVVFSGEGLPSGIYLYRLTAGNFTLTNKMVLAK